MNNPDIFTSKAWLLDGPIHSIPGILHYQDRGLTFLMLEPGTFSDQGITTLLTANGVETTSDPLSWPIELFSVSVNAISRFHIPWYYFGAGVKLIIANRPFRFSFVKPQNTVFPSYYSSAFLKWIDDESQKEVNVIEGRTAGKQWKALLS